MAYEYKNPWGAGGKFWPPKWKDNKWVASAEGARKEAEERAKEKENSERVTSNLKNQFDSNSMQVLSTDSCLTSLIDIISNRLNSIRISYGNKTFSVALLNQIFNELKDLPSAQFDGGIGNCCGAVYGIGVYGLNSENSMDYIDENSSDYFKKSIVIEPQNLGNAKSDENGNIIAKVVSEIINTSQIDRFIKVNIGVYRNEICSV